MQTYPIVLLTLLVTGCATAPRAPDAMCPAIREFAAAQKDSEPHTVELQTEWGGGADILWTKHCDYGEYSPGKALCDYLMANSSVEFPQDNLGRALRCITKDPKKLDMGVFTEFLHVRFFSSSVPGVPDNIGITLELTRDRDDRPPTLAIKAERFDD